MQQSPDPFHPILTASSHPPVDCAMHVSPILRGQPNGPAGIAVWRGEARSRQAAEAGARTARLILAVPAAPGTLSLADAELIRAVLNRGEVVGFLFEAAHEAREFRRTMLRRWRASDAAATHA